jgi:hypothetical protein
MLAVSSAVLLGMAIPAFLRSKTSTQSPISPPPGDQRASAA